MATFSQETSGNRRQWKRLLPALNTGAYAGVQWRDLGCEWGGMAWNRGWQGGGRQKGIYGDGQK